MVDDIDAARGRPSTGRRGLGDVRIGLRLTALSALATVLLAVVGWQAVAVGSQLNRDSAKIYTSNVVPPAALEQFGNTVTIAASSFEQAVLLAGQRRDPAAALAQMQQADSRIDGAATAYTATLDSSTGDAPKKAAMADFTTSWKEWRAHRDAAVAAITGGGTATATAEAASAAVAADKSVAAIHTAYLSEISEAQGTAASAHSTFTRSRTATLVLVAVMILVGLALTTLIARSITRPIGRAVEVIESVGTGDFTRRIGTHRRDEVGRMAAAVDQLAERLSRALHSIADDAALLATSSKELTTITGLIASTADATSFQSTSVSATANQVSANVSTVAAAAEEMSASIGEIAKSATDAAQVAARGAGEAAQTHEIVRQLADASSEIGDVAKLISSIAEQTNLLALNATIEAARAGEAGKGFAVVAGEVKELAKQTGDATAKITDRIDAIQASAGQVVDAIARISTEITTINDTQTTIASAVEEQTATANEIGRSVAEAASGTSEIARSISEVADAATRTAEGTSQSQAAVDQLSRVAHDLRTLVDQFTY